MWVHNNQMKVHFYVKMNYYFPQSLKSSYFKMFPSERSLKGTRTSNQIFFLKNVDFSPRGNQRIQNLKEFFKIEYKKEKLKLLPRKSKNKFWSPHNNKKIASKHWKHNIIALIIFVCLEKTIFSKIYNTCSTILFKSSILIIWF